MALRIIKSSDPITVEQVVVAIYGDPGIGKTSLAFTCESPLLLDFDSGAYRAANRRDTVQAKSWHDVASITADDVAGYKTLIVDTAGRALDALTVDIISRDPKSARSGGALSMQGFGRLKSEFISWLKLVKSFGLDVVLIAHGSETKDGDETKARIDVQGGSKDEIYKSADAMGRLYIRSGKRVLEFSPTDAAFGKNPAQFDTLVVPSFASDPDWFGGIIGAIKSKLNTLSAEQQEVSNLLSAWREKVEGAATSKVLTDLIPEVSALDPRIQENAKRILWAWAKDHGFTFTDGAFVEAGDEAKTSKRRSA